MEYSDDEFEEQLEKDMDAGENPDTLYEAPEIFQKIHRMRANKNI